MAFYKYKTFCRPFIKIGLLKGLLRQKTSLRSSIDASPIEDILETNDHRKIFYRRR